MFPREVKQSSIFRDDDIEDAQIGNQSLHIRQLAPSYQDDPAAGASKTFQRLEDYGRRLTVMGHGAVIIGCEREKLHLFEAALFVPCTNSASHGQKTFSRVPRNPGSFLLAFSSSPLSSHIPSQLKHL